MNKIFKVIWNPATGSYSVAAKRRRAVVRNLVAVSC
ncbi:TPA: ESPR domain-containing protein [Escherichia coli]|nr:ESPR domain-containing protein [Escherichia coli]